VGPYVERVKDSAFTTTGAFPLPSKGRGRARSAPGWVSVRRCSGRHRRDIRSIFARERSGPGGRSPTLMTASPPSAVDLPEVSSSAADSSGDAAKNCLRYKHSSECCIACEQHNWSAFQSDRPAINYLPSPPAERACETMKGPHPEERAKSISKDGHKLRACLGHKLRVRGHPSRCSLRRSSG
jgi:hypothetical protein